mmetsp:Transcript_76231/g.204796  ORF Transcript_76231/g.204796 Transcript_76231/m.204796 type:complete len:515 (+) Transcript_76231:541-2085(+)
MEDCERTARLESSKEKADKLGNYIRTNCPGDDRYELFWKLTDLAQNANCSDVMEVAEILRACQLTKKDGMTSTKILNYLDQLNTEDLKLTRYIGAILMDHENLEAYANSHSVFDFEAEEYAQFYAAYSNVVICLRGETKRNPVSMEDRTGDSIRPEVLEHHVNLLNLTAQGQKGQGDFFFDRQSQTPSRRPEPEAPSSQSRTSLNPGLVRGEATRGVTAKREPLFSQPGMITEDMMVQKIAEVLVSPPLLANGRGVVILANFFGLTRSERQDKQAGMMSIVRQAHSAWPILKAATLPAPSIRHSGINAALESLAICDSRKTIYSTVSQVRTAVSDTLKTRQSPAVLERHLYTLLQWSAHAGNPSPHNLYAEIIAVMYLKSPNINDRIRHSLNDKLEQPTTLEDLMHYLKQRPLTGDFGLYKPIANESISQADADEEVGAMAAVTLSRDSPSPQQPRQGGGGGRGGGGGGGGRPPPPPPPPPRPPPPPCRGCCGLGESRLKVTAAMAPTSSSASA